MEGNERAQPSSHFLFTGLFTSLVGCFDTWTGLSDPQPVHFCRNKIIYQSSRGFEHGRA